jgi:anti-anti-sigma regulatory factor
MEATPQRLALVHSRADSSAVIVCRGWLGSATCGELESLIDAVVHDGIERLRLDLVDVAGFDRVGARCVVTTVERCQASGVAVEIVPEPLLIKESSSHS